jgi:hypothetical protein
VCGVVVECFPPLAEPPAAQSLERPRLEGIEDKRSVCLVIGGRRMPMRGSRYSRVPGHGAVSLCGESRVGACSEWRRVESGRGGGTRGAGFTLATSLLVLIPADLWGLPMYARLRIEDAGASRAIYLGTDASTARALHPALAVHAAALTVAFVQTSTAPRLEDVAVIVKRAGSGCAGSRRGRGARWCGRARGDGFSCYIGCAGCGGISAGSGRSTLCREHG